MKRNTAKQVLVKEVAKRLATFRDGKIIESRQVQYVKYLQDLTVKQLTYVLGGK